MVDTKANIEMAQRLHKDVNHNNVASWMEDPTSQFHMGAGFLLEIIKIIDQWNILVAHGIAGKKNTPDVFGLHINLLQALADLLSAKLDVPEEIIQKIDDFEDKIDECFTQRYTEQLINNTEARKLRKEIRKVYRDLLSRMKEAGILTKVQSDPRLAMADTG